MLDYEDFVRRVRIRYQFRNASQHRTAWQRRLYIPNTSFQPNRASPDIEQYLQEVGNRLHTAILSLPQHQSRHPNLTVQEWHELQRLRHGNRNHSNTDWIIKPADKNLGIAVMTRTWYIHEVMRQLDDPQYYVPFPQNELKPTMAHYYNMLCYRVQQAMNEGTIAQDRTSSFIFLRTTPATAQPGHFYLTIKVHKNPPVGRPIVPSHSWLTQPASIWLDAMLQPVVQRLPHYIRNSTALIQFLETSAIPPNQHVSLVTGDVNSLYPNIPIALGERMLKRTLVSYSRYPPDLIDFINRLADFVLTLNIFEFNGNLYRQVQGTAMGTAFAPCYANCVMQALEDELFEQYHAQGQSNMIPWYYRRYIDDIIIIWTSEAHLQHDQLLRLLNDLNHMAPTIHINWSYTANMDQIEFLDARISLGQRFQQTRHLDIQVHQKQLNMYLYMPYQSFHPYHAKLGFIKAELQRFVRLSSAFKDYLHVRKLFYQRLRARGYPPSLLHHAFQQVSYHERPHLLVSNNTHSTGSIQDTPPLVFVTTNTPQFTSEQWRGIINPKPTELPLSLGGRVTVALKNSANLARQLCRAQL